MIVSPARLEDMKQRAWYLAQIEDALVNNCPETAKTLGEHSKWLANRIKTKDYSQEDRYLEWEKQWITR